MVEGLEALAQMEYPGRVIIIGQSTEAHNVVIYAITGRSASSQARRLVADKEHGTIKVRPTDEQVLKTGNANLLVYPSIRLDELNNIFVSNGIQTDLIYEVVHPGFDDADAPRNALELLMDAFSLPDLVEDIDITAYEPDNPNFTPRISGVVYPNGENAALFIVKRAEDDSAMRQFFEVPLIPGKGKMIATYTGENVNPLPSFKGEPIDVSLPYAKVEEAVNAMYDAMAPKEGKPDFRVSTAGVYVSKDKIVSMAVKNRHDGGN